MDIKFSIENDIKKGHIQNALQKFDDLEKEKISLSQNLIELKAKCFAEEDNLVESIKILESSPLTSNGELLTKYKLFLKVESNSPTTITEQNNYSMFNKWLQENGAKFDKVKLVYYEQNYRGIHARKSIKKGEILISIPSNLLICTENGFKSKLGSILYSKKYENTFIHLLYLTLFFFEEAKKEDTFWRPYLNLIPDNMNNVPIFFNKEEKRLLTGTRAFKNFDIDNDWYDKMYNELIDISPEFKAITLDEIKFWMTLIMTRIFYIKNCEIMQSYIVAPFADMVNYDSINAEMVEWGYNQSNNSFTIVARRDIERGETIFLNYGKKSHYQFLYFYGFIDDNNTLVKKYIEFDIPTDISFYKEKIEILQSYNVELLFSNEFKSMRNLRQFTILRWLFDARKFSEINYFAELSKTLEAKYPADIKLIIDVISKSNEIQLLRFLALVCEDHIKKFLTTIEEDKKILENPNMTFNLRNIYRMNYNKKMLLYSLIELCQRAIKFLDGSVSLNTIDDLKFDWGYPYYMIIKRFLLKNK